MKGRRIVARAALGLSVAVVGVISSGLPRVAVAEEKRSSLKVSIDRDKVDLDAHRLEVRLSKTASHVTIKVIGESGTVLADEQHDFAGKPPGTPLVVTWQPKSGEPVARIDVFGYDKDGYYSGVRLSPWSVSIPHEEVNFETNKAIIRDSEEPKLEDSLRRIREAMKAHRDLGRITLFVVGHTDTQGSSAHNLALSRRRARSIAAWFRGHGLSIPIAYAGLGETALAVKTADEVDEPKNRRVDYVLSIEEPRLKRSGATVGWNRL